MRWRSTSSVTVAHVSVVFHVLASNEVLHTPSPMDGPNPETIAPAGDQVKLGQLTCPDLPDGAPPPRGRIMIIG